VFAHLCLFKPAASGVRLDVSEPAPDYPHRGSLCHSVVISNPATVTTKGRQARSIIDLVLFRVAPQHFAVQLLSKDQPGGKAVFRLLPLW
jgi:hypothetical protein